MPKGTWVFDPDAGGKTIPEAVKRRTEDRIRRHAEKHFAGKYARLDIRFRGQFCYIDAYTEPAVPKRLPLGYPESHEELLEQLRKTPTHLFRLRYFGNEERWGFGCFAYSSEKYELSVFPTGDFFGTPEEAFQTAAQASGVTYLALAFKISNIEPAGYSGGFVTGKSSIHRGDRSAACGCNQTKKPMESCLASPKGAKWESLGHRPRENHSLTLAPKGRNRFPPYSAPLGLPRQRVRIPGALPQAPIWRPVGAETNQNFLPKKQVFTDLKPKDRLEQKPENRLGLILSIFLRGLRVLAGEFLLIKEKNAEDSG